jgi:hypothetical protein
VALGAKCGSRWRRTFWLASIPPLPDRAGAGSLMPTMSRGSRQRYGGGRVRRTGSNPRAWAAVASFAVLGWALLKGGALLPGDRLIAGSLAVVVGLAWVTAGLLVGEFRPRFWPSRATMKSQLPALALATLAGLGFSSLLWSLDKEASLSGSLVLFGGLVYLQLGRIIGREPTEIQLLALPAGRISVRDSARSSGCRSCGASPGSSRSGV